MADANAIATAAAAAAAAQYQQQTWYGDTGWQQQQPWKGGGGGKGGKGWNSNWKWNSGKGGKGGGGGTPGQGGVTLPKTIAEKVESTFEWIEAQKKAGTAAPEAAEAPPFLFPRRSARGATATPRVTCLLYTSPSPRDGLLSRMPSSA